MKEKIARIYYPIQLEGVADCLSTGKNYAVLSYTLSPAFWGECIILCQITLGLKFSHASSLSKGDFLESRFKINLHLRIIRSHRGDIRFQSLRLG